MSHLQNLQSSCGLVLLFIVFASCESQRYPKIVLTQHLVSESIGRHAFITETVND